MINLDTMVPPLKSEYDIPSILPLSNLIFDREKMMSGGKQIVKDDEDHDGRGGSKGTFFINSKFNIIVLMNLQDPDADDEIVQMVLDELPHQDKFVKLYISPTE